MLLEGSFVKDIEKWMDALKVTRRQTIRDGNLQVATKSGYCIINWPVVYISHHYHATIMKPMCDNESMVNVVLIFRLLFLLQQIHEKVVQFILSAATIPTMGTRSVHRYITKRFPQVSDVTAYTLAQHTPRCFLCIQKNIFIPELACYINVRIMCWVS
jgi:hypothetical protein